jgi:hypothetical protein
MYEIQVYIENARTPWVASGNLPRKENNFATREEAAKMLTKIRSSGMDYRVVHLDLIKIKAQIKAILSEPSKLQRIAKLLEEK